MRVGHFLILLHERNRAFVNKASPIRFRGDDLRIHKNICELVRRCRLYFLSVSRHFSFAECIHEGIFCRVSRTRAMIESDDLPGEPHLGIFRMKRPVGESCFYFLDLAFRNVAA